MAALAVLLAAQTVHVYVLWEVLVAKLSVLVAHKYRVAIVPMGIAVVMLVATLEPHAS
tara:strand:+ start:976 stop:1149 length:174 start_codon:yes stop_codon:yes gene_type:complete